jgi:hypothetical protein
LVVVDGRDFFSGWLGNNAPGTLDHWICVGSF